MDSAVFLNQWRHLYCVFTYIRSLLIKKDGCARRNISIKFTCACPTVMPSIFNKSFSLSFPLFCVNSVRSMDERSCFCISWSGTEWLWVSAISGALGTRPSNQSYQQEQRLSFLWWYSCMIAVEGHKARLPKQRHWLNHQAWEVQREENVSKNY